MCGRFNVVSHPLARLLLEITGQEYPLEDRYNIAPTEQVPVLLREERDWQLREMRWWLVPRWADEPSTRYSMFNAKSESLQKSRAYREPFAERRCLIPASGYYEWQKAASGKIPWYMEPRESDGFAFAGLWDRWQRDERLIESCTLITTRVHPELAFIHNRMPFCLTRAQVELWVDPTTPLPALQEMLAGQVGVPMRAAPVSTYVNNSRNKGERCVEAVGEAIAIG